MGTKRKGYVPVLWGGNVFGHTLPTTFLLFVLQKYTVGLMDTRVVDFVFVFVDGSIVVG
jgi:hypothetical protein